MSETLPPSAPESDSAAPSVEATAPGDETAVTEGSAGAETKYVEASRFNGLMSKHQEALSALEQERQLRAVLEARINGQETAVTDDNGALDEVRQLREELRTERLEAAKVRVLDKYPDARPLADLIVGNTPEEIESVAQAIATRLQAMKPAGETTTGEEAAATAAVEETAPEAAPEAPVIGGGSSAPATPTAHEAVSAAIQSRDWSGYWAAKLGAPSQLA